MGWWSTTIMGGDAPFDARHDLIEALGLSLEDDDFMDGSHFHFDGEPLEFYRDLINERIDHLITIADQGGTWTCDEYRMITYQVLGVMILETGAKMPAGVRGRILGAAQADEWAQLNEERKAHIDDLIEKVKEYPAEGGEPVHLAYEGLMAKITNLLGA